MTSKRHVQGHGAGPSYGHYPHKETAVLFFPHPKYRASLPFGMAIAAEYVGLRTERP